MEAVQRALGSASGFEDLSANRAITAEDAGKTFQLTAAGVVVTFPDSTTLPIGWEVTILADGSASCTLAGSSFISSRGGFVSGSEGFSLKIHARKNLNQYRVSHMGDGPASLAASGYQKLPSGLIIQWGRVANSATPLAGTAVTFPIAFPTACHAVVSGNASTATSGVTSVAAGISTTGFTSSSSSAGLVAPWLAIGN
jgi:hypothetical protein